MEMSAVRKVAEHYSPDGLVDRVRDALKANGLEVGNITAEQLEGLDQFHSRGLAATVDMARDLNPGPEDQILDIGSGLGGPSRYLARTYGSRVTGIDLSDSFVDAAEFLAERAGLSRDVAYQQADALELPFMDEQFDIVWTQHVAMNIADRSRFYGEAHRVLRPGGRMAIYDVLHSHGGPLIYPVPWARDESTSFVMTPEGMREVLEKTGFAVESWIDRTADARLWFEELAKRQEENPSVSRPLGLHIAMGPDFRIMSGNLRRNLLEGRACLIEAILRRD
jgi:ubiquinone/menaquinone biosynthesis C-methylase UbiE